VLSPLLWSLVVEDLLWELSDNGHYTVGCTDDIAISISGKFLQTVSEVLQTALFTVHQWCKRTNVSIDPNKTVIIPFTRKRNIKGREEAIFFSKTIQLSSEVKYLGWTLDKGLAWEKQLDKVTNKAYKAFWIYTVVVRPIVTYAATVWWHRVKIKTSQAEPSKLQRMSCLGITGAMRTAPTAAILDSPPLHLQVEAEAKAGNYWVCND
jgi:hypothetical protein